jgi:hypothetical protein
MKQLLFLIVVSGNLLTFAQAKPQSGEIKGTVTDQNGNPIPAATVYAVQRGLVFNDVTPRSVKTDGNGAFDFRGGFSLGAYNLYSGKDEDAYPDPLDRFYSDPKAEVPRVTLTPDHPSATVTVKLGAQAGVISGRILDADTSTPIKAYLGFVDSDGHGHSVFVNGNYHILVPAGKLITLMVTVLGPTSDRSQVPVAPLRLEPGQYVNLDLPVSPQ